MPPNNQNQQPQNPVEEDSAPSKIKKGVAVVAAGVALAGGAKIASDALDGSPASSENLQEQEVDQNRPLKGAEPEIELPEEWGGPKSNDSTTTTVQTPAKPANPKVDIGEAATAERESTVGPDSLEIEFPEKYEGEHIVNRAMNFLDSFIKFPENTASGVLNFNSQASEDASGEGNINWSTPDYSITVGGEIEKGKISMDSSEESQKEKWFSITDSDGRTLEVHFGPLAGQEGSTENPSVLVVDENGGAYTNTPDAYPNASVDSSELKSHSEKVLDNVTSSQ